MSQRSPRKSISSARYTASAVGVPTVEELLKQRQEKHQQAIEDVKRKQEARKLAIIKTILDEEERLRGQKEKMEAKEKILQEKIAILHGSDKSSTKLIRPRTDRAEGPAYDPNRSDSKLDSIDGVDLLHHKFDKTQLDRFDWNDMESELDDKDLAATLLTSGIHDTYSHGTSASSVRDILEASLIPMPELPSKLVPKPPPRKNLHALRHQPRIAATEVSAESSLQIMPPSIEFTDIVPFPEQSRPNIQVVNVVNTSTSTTYRIRHPHLVEASMDLNDQYSKKGADWCQCFIMGTGMTRLMEISQWYAIPPGGCVRIGIEISFSPYDKDPYKTLTTMESKKNEKERIMRAVLRVEFYTRNDDDENGLLDGNRPTLCAFVKCVLAHANLYASVEKPPEARQQEIKVTSERFDLKFADVTIGESAIRILKICNSSPVGTTALLRTKNPQNFFKVLWDERDSSQRKDVVWKGWIDANSSVSLQVKCGPFPQGELYATDFQLEYHALDAWKTKLEPGITSLVRKYIYIRADAVDLPFHFETSDINVCCIRCGDLYRACLVVRNTSLLTEPFSIQVQNYSHHEATGTDMVSYTIPGFGTMDISPISGILHAGESITVWMKLHPLHDPAPEQIGEVPFEISLHLQSPKFSRFHTATISGSISSKKFKIEPQVIDIGRISIGEGKKVSVNLSTYSCLGSEVGFINLPSYIQVLPSETFIKLPPSISTITPVELKLVIAPPKVGKFRNQLIIKSIDGEQVQLTCKGEVVAPPLEFEIVPGNCVNFGRIAVSKEIFSQGYGASVILRNTLQKSETDDCTIQYEFADVIGIWDEIGKTIKWEYACGHETEEKIKNHPRAVLGPFKIQPRSGSLKMGEKKLIYIRLVPELQHYVCPFPSEKTAADAAPTLLSESLGDSQFIESTHTWQIPCMTRKKFENGYGARSLLHLQVDAAFLGPLIKITEPSNGVAEFGTVPLFQIIEKEILLQSLSPNLVKVKLSHISPEAPFTVLEGHEIDLLPDEVKRLTLQFYARQNGKFFEFLEFHTFDRTLSAKSVHKLKLSGEGVQGELSFDPPTMHLDLGNTLLGETAIKNITVTNESNVLLTGSVSLSANSKFECWPMRLQLEPREKQVITVKFWADDEVPMVKDVIRFYVQSRKHSFKVNVVGRCWASTGILSGFESSWEVDDSAGSSAFPSKLLTFSDQISRILLSNQVPISPPSAVNRLVLVELRYPETQNIVIMNIKPGNVNSPAVAWNSATPLKQESLIKAAADLKKSAPISFEIIPVTQLHSLPTESIAQYVSRLAADMAHKDQDRGVLISPTRGNVETGNSVQLQLSSYESAKQEATTIHRPASSDKKKPVETFFFVKISGGLMIVKGREAETQSWVYNLVPPGDSVPGERLILLRVTH